MTAVQRASLALIVVIAFGGLLWFSSWRTAADYRPLYQGMAEADAAQATEALKTANIPYRFKDNGDTSILVPSGQLAEARLLLAREGLPKSGRIGFELFDQTSFGTTDFAEQINYQRALEGELERTVMTLSEVERARVHVTFSKDSVFSDYRQPAKASIVLTLRHNAALAKGNISAITNLAASAVEGLSPDQVTLVDDRGNLLNKPRTTGNDAVSAPDGQIEYRMTLERSVLDKVTQALDPVLGNGRYRTGVSVDCDFSGVDESEEIWDPTKSVMTQNQVTEESSTGRSGGGVPGTAANLPTPPPQSTQKTGTTRHTENTSYQSSRKVRHVQQPRGNVKRITLAVLLDQESQWVGTGKDAKLTFTPPTPEKIAVIKNMVVNVAGIDTQRGDQVTVESLPFETTARPEPLVTAPTGVVKPGSPVDQLMKLDRKILGGIAVGIALLVGLGTFLLIKRRKAKAKAAALTATAQIEAADQGALPPGATAQLSAGTGDSDEDLLLALRTASKNTNTAEALTKFLREQVHKDPQNVAQLLHTWLEEERAH